MQLRRRFVSVSEIDGFGDLFMRLLMFLLSDGEYFFKSFVFSIFGQFLEKTFISLGELFSFEFIVDEYVGLVDLVESVRDYMFSQGVFDIKKNLFILIKEELLKFIFVDDNFEYVFKLVDIKKKM